MRVGNAVRVIKKCALKTTHTQKDFSLCSVLAPMYLSCPLISCLPSLYSFLNITFTLSWVFFPHSPTHKHSVGLKLHTVVGCIPLWITASSCCYCRYTCVPHSYRQPLLPSLLSPLRPHTPHTSTPNCESSYQANRPLLNSWLFEFIRERLKAIYLCLI